MKEQTWLQIHVIYEFTKFNNAEYVPIAYQFDAKPASIVSLSSEKQSFSPCWPPCAAGHPLLAVLISYGLMEALAIAVRNFPLPVTGIIFWPSAFHSSCCSLSANNKSVTVNLCAHIISQLDPHKNVTLNKQKPCIHHKEYSFSSMNHMPTNKKIPRDHPQDKQPLTKWT